MIKFKLYGININYGKIYKIYRYIAIFLLIALFPEIVAGALILTSPSSVSLSDRFVSTASQTSTSTVSYIEVSDDRANSPGWNATMTSTHFTTIGPVITTAGTNNTVSTSGTYDGTYGITAPVKKYTVQIETGGAVGTASYKWKVDDGTWSATSTTAATVTLEKGISVNFAAATYVAGDQWQFGVDVFPYTDLYVTPSSITVVNGSCTNCTVGAAEYLSGTGSTSDSKSLMVAPPGNGTGIFRQDEGLNLTLHANSINATYSAVATFTVL